MKALFVTAAFCFLLLGGLLRGDQSSAPTTQSEEIAQLRKQIETLEERVERLERRLDRKFRPRVVPLIGVGISRELP
jgi:chromosome segregation ATPase